MARRAAAATSSQVDLQASWRRPRDRKGGVCGYTLRGLTCIRRGAHYCEPRANKVVAFFAEHLVHTKGIHTRRAFILEPWQEWEIIRPLFGEVLWSAEQQAYVRRYRTGYVILARKNGKALAVDTPVLTGKGWSTMGALVPGDQVHSIDGSLTEVTGISERWQDHDCYRVTFADGASLVANAAHEWTVRDHRYGTTRTVETTELFRDQRYGGRGDRRFSVDVPAALDRPAEDLPVDPYLLGAWLGDGSSTKAEITTADESMVEAFAAAGYAPTYRYTKGRGRAATVGFLRLLLPLRAAGVLRNKHVPEEYAHGSRVQRLALLQGLMDTDGCVNVGPNTPRVEFCNTNQRLAEGVLFLARSLGYKATIKESRSTLNGKDCGPRWRVTWTAYRDDAPFRLTRKADLLAARPERLTRAGTNMVSSVERVQSVETVCIEVAHPSHEYLAGESLTPTHNSELAAGCLLYLLIGDDEDAAEIYSAAADTKQAGKVFEPAKRMSQLSPALHARLTHNKNARRLIDEKTSSYYEVITADADTELGHNPHGFVLDEVLSQRDDSLWQALDTARGTRSQELMLAFSTETDQQVSFGASLIDEAERIAEDPSRNWSVFSYVRKLPSDVSQLRNLIAVYPDHPDLPVVTVLPDGQEIVDPFDERNWKWPNPALDMFLSRESMRRDAETARNEPAKENSFKQFKLNMRVSQATRWMPMHLWDTATGELWLTPEQRLPELTGRTAYFGLDLSARFDLTAWCLLFPGAEADLLWRFWCPESALKGLDEATNNQASVWANAGWLTITEGDVLDYDVVYSDIARDSSRYRLAAGDADEWSSYPVIQEIGNRTSLKVDETLTAYKSTFERMSPGMTDLMAMVREGRIAHHGNPVARWCFDNVEVRHAPYNPDVIRPDKPARLPGGKRIDGVPAAVMAINASRRPAPEPKRTPMVHLWPDDLTGTG